MPEITGRLRAPAQLVTHFPVTNPSLAIRVTNSAHCPSDLGMQQTEMVSCSAGGKEQQNSPQTSPSRIAPPSPMISLSSPRLTPPSRMTNFLPFRRDSTVDLSTNENKKVVEEANLIISDVANTDGSNVNAENPKLHNRIDDDEEDLVTPVPPRRSSLLIGGIANNGNVEASGLSESHATGVRRVPASGSAVAASKHSTANTKNPQSNGIITAANKRRLPQLSGDSSLYVDAAAQKNKASSVRTQKSVSPASTTHNPATNNGNIPLIKRQPPFLAEKSITKAAAVAQRQQSKKSVTGESSRKISSSNVSAKSDAATSNRTTTANLSKQKSPRSDQNATIRSHSSRNGAVLPGASARRNTLLTSHSGALVAVSSSATSNSSKNQQQQLVDSLQQQNDTLNAVIAALNNDKDNLQQELQSIKADSDAARQNYAVQIAELEARLREAELVQQQLNDQLLSAQNANFELHTQLGTISTQHSQLQYMLNDLNVTHQQLTAQYAVLESKQDHLRMQHEEDVENLSAIRAESESWQQRCTAAQQIADEQRTAFDVERTKLADELRTERAETDKQKNIVQRIQRERRALEREKTGAEERRDAALAEAKLKADELSSWQAVCELREREKKDLTRQLMLLQSDVERLNELEQAKVVLERQLECANASLTIKHDKHQEALAEIDRLQTDLSDSLRERDQLSKTNQDLSFRLDEVSTLSMLELSVSDSSTPNTTPLSRAGDAADEHQFFASSASGTSHADRDAVSPAAPQPPFRRNHVHLNSSGSSRRSFSIRDHVEGMKNKSTSSDA